MMVSENRKTSMDLNTGELKMKVDKPLNLVRDKEQSNSKIKKGIFSAKEFNVINSNR